MIAANTANDHARAADAIRARTDRPIRVGIVLGSGLGGLASMIEDAVMIPYHEIPGFPQSTVQGHRGQLVIGKLEGQDVIAQQGRVHFYEGYSAEQITFPIRVMKALGTEIVIMTNAAGGLNRTWGVGDVMLFNDHINFVGLAGNHPLVGPHDPAYGERFVGMSNTYDRELRQIARRAAANGGVPLREGVYACVSGPSFETPAEIRALRMMGADAVGMSTANEVIVARQAGMRVLAFSGITNVAIDRIDGTDEATHQEVLDAGRILVPRLTAVLRGVLQAL